MKKIKSVSIVVLLILALGLSTLVSKAENPGTITILKPTTNEEVLFYNKITVKFSVTDNFPWRYDYTDIYISGIFVERTSGGEGSPFEKQYYPQAYAGSHTVRVTAYFSKFGWPPERRDIEEIKYFTINNIDDTTDLEDFRIDKLHDYETGKYYLDGSGVTICIIDDLIGCDDSLSFFHESLWRTCYGGATENRYIDIKYFTHSDGDFYEEWDVENPTKEEKWQEIYDEGKGNYDLPSEVHGTYCMAVLRHIAPAANYIFIETLGNKYKTVDAIEWLVEDRNDPVYGNKAPFEFLGIDIISMSWSEQHGEGYYVPLEDEFQTLTNAGVIPVCAAGQCVPPETEGSVFYLYYEAFYPCSFESVIGVTGVIDSDTTLGSGSRWNRDIRANSGWGVDIAASFAGTILDWAPVPSFDEFAGTSNACPMVAGIIALLEEYQDSYRPNEDLTVSLVQLLFQKTGDALGSAPSQQGEYIFGSYSWLQNAYPGYPYVADYEHAIYTTSNCGWGIIDGYEMWKYFKLNY